MIGFNQFVDSFNFFKDKIGNQLEIYKKVYRNTCLNLLLLIGVLFTIALFIALLGILLGICVFFSKRGGLGAFKELNKRFDFI